MSHIVVVACYGLDGNHTLCLPTAVRKGFDIAIGLLKQEPNAHLFSASWSGTDFTAEEREKQGILQACGISPDRATLTRCITNTFDEVRQIVAFITRERQWVRRVTIISDILHASQMRRMFVYFAKQEGLSLTVEHKSFIGGWHHSHPSPYNRSQYMRLVACIPREFLWLAYRYAGLDWIARAHHPQSRT